VEIFNPVKNKYKSVAPLHTARHGHSATLLRDGRVLVIGGYTLPQQWLGDAEIYDPSSDTWTQTYPLYKHGVTHTATVMKDGRVLVVGGCIGDGVCTERAEIFNPKTDSWIDVPPLQSDRASHIAQLLDNGHVLVAGGTGASGQIPTDGASVLYNPRTNTWTSAGPMVNPRLAAKAVLLPNGCVLVAGGNLLDYPNFSVTNTSEIYNPATNTWTAAASLSQARSGFLMNIFPTGQTLVVGGARDSDCCWSATSFVQEVESYNYRKNTWTVVANLPQPGAFMASTFLPNWQLWVTGGQNEMEHLDDTWLISTK
jgi:N-acetylneuraminic acid mutarotase